MKENKTNIVSFIDLPKSNPATTKREIVLLGESEIGEKLNGNRFFETAHGTFESIKDAEIFAERNIRQIRWVVGERITRDGGGVTYDFKSKPRSARYND